MKGWGFQAFGSPVLLGCFLPYSLRQWQHLAINKVIQFTPPPELVLRQWGEGGPLLSELKLSFLLKATNSSGQFYSDSGEPHFLLF